MKKIAILIAAGLAAQAHAFGIQSSVSVNVGQSDHQQESSQPSQGGPIGFGLGIARDAVGAGLSITRGATEASLNTAQAVTEASLQTAGSIVSQLTRSDRRALRSYCADRPLTRRQKARFAYLPDDWEQDVRRSQPLPEEVEQHAIVIPAKQAGLRNRPSASVVLRVENKLILVDARTDVVVDIMSL